MQQTSTKIVCKKWYWSFVPLAGRKRFSSTLGRTIYLTPKRYNNYYSASPSIYTLALVAHEKVHVQQYDADPLGFPFYYILSRTRRMNYEVEAYVAQIHQITSGYPDLNRQTLIGKKADNLASWRYLLFISRARAVELITEALDDRTKS